MNNRISLTQPNPKLENVIIFGASGFIGNNLRSHLQKKTGLEITGYSSSECDLLEPPQAVDALKNCNSGTSIVLCSAIPRRKEDSGAAMLKNIEMVHNLCAGIPDAGIRSFIFMSSMDVYGGHPGIGVINEQTATKPNGHYGVSKLMSEILLPIELPPQTPLSILRLPGVYGPADQGNSIVGLFVEKLLLGEAIEITGDGTAKRDFVHVGDLCQVVENAIEQPFSGVLNVATGVSTSVADIAKKTAKVLNQTHTAEHLPSRSAEYDLVFDNSRLTRLIPGMQFKDLEQGIAEYAANHKETHPVPQPAKYILRPNRKPVGP